MRIADIYYIKIHGKATDFGGILHWNSYKRDTSLVTYLQPMYTSAERMAGSIDILSFNLQVFIFSAPPFFSSSRKITSLYFGVVRACIQNLALQHNVISSNARRGATSKLYM